MKKEGRRNREVEEKKNSVSLHVQFLRRIEEEASFLSHKKRGRIKREQRGSWASLPLLLPGGREFFLSSLFSLSFLSLPPSASLPRPLPPSFPPSPNLLLFPDALQQLVSKRARCKWRR